MHRRPSKCKPTVVMKHGHSLCQCAYSAASELCRHNHNQGDLMTSPYSLTYLAPGLASVSIAVTNAYGKVLRRWPALRESGDACHA